MRPFRERRPLTEANGLICSWSEQHSFFFCSGPAILTVPPRLFLTTRHFERVEQTVPESDELSELSVPFVISHRACLF